MRAPEFLHGPERYGSNAEECARVDAMNADYNRRHPEKAAVLEQWRKGEITGEEAGRRIEKINQDQEARKKEAVDCLLDRMDEDGIPV